MRLAWALGGEICREGHLQLSPRGGLKVRHREMGTSRTRLGRSGKKVVPPICRRVCVAWSPLCITQAPLLHPLLGERGAPLLPAPRRFVPRRVLGPSLLPAALQRAITCERLHAPGLALRVRAPRKQDGMPLSLLSS